MSVGVYSFVSNGRAHIVVPNIAVDEEKGIVPNARVKIFVPILQRHYKKTLPSRFDVARKFTLTFAVSVTVLNSVAHIGDTFKLDILASDDEPITPPLKKHYRSDKKRIDASTLPPKKKLKYIKATETADAEQLLLALRFSKGNFAREIATRSSTDAIIPDASDVPSRATLLAMSKDMCEWWLKRVPLTHYVNVNNRKEMQYVLLNHFGYTTADI